MAPLPHQNRASTAPSDVESAATSLKPPILPVQAQKDSRRKPPTERLTIRQLLYLIVLHGLGAALISGGINFAVAYALYTSPGARRDPVRLFQLPNTLAGDAAVTAIAQGLVTWAIEGVLVNLDLRNGLVAPFVGWVEPVQPWRRLLWGLNEPDNLGKVGRWTWFVVGEALRALALAVLSFVVVFGPTLGILISVGTKVGGDWEFERTWAPQIYKLVYGAVLGLLSTPIMAFVWLVRRGWTDRNADEYSSVT
jgi:hypothetical protein